MSAQPIQESPTDDGGGGGQTTLQSTAFASNCKLHNTIACFVTVSGNATPPTSVIDDAGQHYTLRTTAFDSGAGNQAVHLYDFQNNASATKLRVTATYGTNQTGFGIWPAELDSTALASFDNADSRISIFAGTGANAITSNVITPTSSAALCYSLIMEILNGDGSGIVPGTGYTAGVFGWNFGGPTPLGRSQWKLLTSATPTAATATDATNSDFAVMLGMYDSATATPVVLAWVG